MAHRISTSQLIVKEIQENIANKLYIPGDKLPTERKLAEQYGVSRIPVREAIKILAEMGLVESRHGSGTFVKEPNTARTIELMRQYLQLNRQSALEILQLRGLLETQAAREAALNRDKEDMRRIAELEEKCAREIDNKLHGNPHNFKQADFAFHRAVALASHNHIFTDFINLIHNSMGLHQGILTAGNENMDFIRRHHHELRLALENKDPAAAQAAMARHLEHILVVVKNGMKVSGINGK